MSIHSKGRAADQVPDMAHGARDPFHGELKREVENFHNTLALNSASNPA